MDTVITVIIILSVVSIVAICICLCIFCRKYFIRRNYEVLEKFPFGKCKCLHGKTCPKSRNDYTITGFAEKSGVKDETELRVYKVIDKANNKIYAMKESEPGSITLTEEKVLKKAAVDNVNNIVRLYHTFEDDGKIYFIMELCITNLEATIKHQHLEVNRIKKYFRMIIRGLEYLHDEHGYVHRDIRPRNILIASDDTVRISNFQSCLEPNSPINFKKKLMDPPEFLENSKFGFFYDSWHVGLTLVQVCSQFNPTDPNTIPEFLRTNYRMSSYQNAFDRILKFKLLRLDYNERLWGKDLPKAADDDELRECFGIRLLRKVLHHYY